MWLRCRTVAFLLVVLQVVLLVILATYRRVPEPSRQHRSRTRRFVLSGAPQHEQVDEVYSEVDEVNRYERSSTSIASHHAEVPCVNNQVLEAEVARLTRELEDAKRLSQKTRTEEDAGGHERMTVPLEPYRQPYLQPITAFIREGDLLHRPTIGYLLGVTSRGIEAPSVQALAPFIHAIPSLVQTAIRGFQYAVYLGFDDRDAFYDTRREWSTVVAWFDENATQPLRRRGIDVSLKGVRVKNEQKKPGPVFNELARVAFEDGVSYFFRLNDDTELTSPWVRLHSVYHSEPRCCHPSFALLTIAVSDSRPVSHNVVLQVHGVGFC